MRKFQETFNAIAEVRSMLRGKTTKLVKRQLGDSTENNRTLTVSQVVRYLNKSGAKKLAKRVQVSAEVLKDIILTRRSRTDAIDINELVTTYRNVVMNGRSSTYRKKIGLAISKVG